MSGFRVGEFRKDALPAALRRFCPARSVDSLLEIDLAVLAASGKRLILLDVDNTLLPWRCEDIPPPTQDWVAEAKRRGFALCILSNTRHPARLERIAEKLGVRHLRGRFKPNPAMFRRALSQFRVRPEDSVMIGDQIFTDVWGANRAGIEAIWVRPMAGREFFGTKVSRLGERLLRPLLYRAMDAEDRTEGSLAWSGTGVGGLLSAPVLRQFFKFAIVGGSSTIIDLGLHYTLMFVVPLGAGTLGSELGAWLTTSAPGAFSFAGRPTDAAFPVLKVVSASVAILNSFYWNRLWTFKIRGKEERLEQLHRFVIVSLIGMALNTLITTGLNNVIPGHPKRSWAVASAIATVIVAFWSFTGQKMWAFRQRRT